jgi:predicted amidohydrolase
MTKLIVGGAQMGPIQKADSREAAVARMIALLEEAASKKVEMLVYPELALTTFFPRWYMEDQAEVDAWFEREMPNAATAPLFARAKDLGIAITFGYAELTADGHHFNTSILTNRRAEIIGKYRKVHLPGHSEYDPERTHQHLEKRYFEPGDLGFDVWRNEGVIMGMAICNDRRWPETYRVMGLQGVEMIMLGYNTPVHNPPSPEHDNLSNFHNQLVMQSGAYQNGTWVVGVAKCGCEEGCDMIGNSSIIAPSGEIVGACTTLGDELAVARCDLDLCNSFKNWVFNFAVHREPEQYRMIVERKGSIVPPQIA